MSQDIFYYNFAWKDYGEAHSMLGLLDMVKVNLSYTFLTLEILPIKRNSRINKCQIIGLTNFPGTFIRINRR